MSSDENQVQNIYKYCRKSLKKSKRGTQHTDITHSQDDTNNEDIDILPRSGIKTDGINSVPGCSCSVDVESEIANILHKKCPVITLAQQQLQRLLEETDQLFCDNTRCCRSIYDFVRLCKEILVSQNKCYCFFIILFTMAFLIGIVLGAASCGTSLRRFNSPLLTCLDNLFMPDTYTKIENTYHCIV
ncbi:uncharacterized protein LOC115445829 [Manduca sexta]|uniref:uncharacterized protein LOC115445829 n=1 Tax=Manduca sexta TaxID=7130 RepID=UPI00118221BB|nr:uncharacterized protein LOC115445829 [Manduca sexta]